MAESGNMMRDGAMDGYKYFMCVIRYLEWGNALLRWMQDYVPCTKYTKIKDNSSHRSKRQTYALHLYILDRSESMILALKECCPCRIMNYKYTESISGTWHQDLSPDRYILEPERGARSMI